MNAQRPVRIAASPINWHNDDFPILGSVTSVETILGGMRAAGFDGTALSSLFPTTAGELLPLLDQYELTLASGWHSAYLLTQDFNEERERFVQFVQFLSEMGSDLLTIAECSYCPFKPYPASRFNQHYPALAKPLFPYQLPTLHDDQWAFLGQSLDEFSVIAAKSGVKVGYHPHMQTVVQNADQLARLAEEAPDLRFTIDTGHMAFSGANPVQIIEKYIDRIVYVHVKNIRQRVVDAAVAGSMPFEFAVIEGAFTVPGDGGIDFTQVFAVLMKHSYEGWLLVEAEQNPLTADPVLYGTLARQYIREVTGW